MRRPTPIAAFLSFGQPEEADADRTRATRRDHRGPAAFNSPAIKAGLPDYDIQVPRSVRRRLDSHHALRLSEWVLRGPAHREQGSWHLSNRGEIHASPVSATTDFGGRAKRLLFIGADGLLEPWRDLERLAVQRQGALTDRNLLE
jgi:hypothetical protein